MTPAVSIFSPPSALLDEAVKGRGVEMRPACSGDIPLQGTSSAPWTPATPCASGCVMCCVNRRPTGRGHLFSAGDAAGFIGSFRSSTTPSA